MAKSTGTSTTVHSYYLLEIGACHYSSNPNFQPPLLLLFQTQCILNTICNDPITSSNDLSSIEIEVIQSCFSRTFCIHNHSDFHNNSGKYIYHFEIHPCFVISDIISRSRHHKHRGFQLFLFCQHMCES